VTDITVAHSPSRAASAGDYFALMKPRVMSLVIFTGLAGLVAAPVRVDPVIAFSILLSIAAAAGASGALNMWYDADIDAKMARTRTRPVPSGRIRGDEALGLGVAISVLSVLLMLLSGGVLAAGLLAFTIWFYAHPYTMILKRRTPENIVIGGLAGALPPAIAWAGATGGLTLDPLLLVAIIFMWTPPHFWALSLTHQEDYAAANVPMLPLTHGPGETRKRILLYSLVLAPLGFAPVFTGLGGWLYAITAGLGGVMFVLIAVRLARSKAGDTGQGDKVANKPAIALFAYSILYLAALFAAVIVEHGLGLYRAIG
jgi:protoheme IX farnesyltransferase